MVASRMVAVANDVKNESYTPRTQMRLVSFSFAASSCYENKFSEITTSSIKALW